MSKVALYRKYRPQNFDEMYGQKPIIKTLQTSIKLNNITHAYIFSGNRGSGKTTIAKIFSKAINCLNTNDGNPCNQCANCIAINSNSTSDFVELDAASNNGVDEVRSIINLTNYMPNQLKYKVYIIDEAHMLTTNSWNALLKTIEEPPSYVIFIFATTEYHKIPATIVSRCQWYDFYKLPKADLNELISNVSSKENIKIEPKAIESISLLADGAARDALSILDQLSTYGNKVIKQDDIDEIFGLVSIPTKISLINKLFSKDTNSCFEIINNMFLKGANISQLLSSLVDIVMDKLIFLQTKNERLIKNVTLDEINMIENASEKELIRFIEIFSEAHAKSKILNNPQFVLQFYVLKFISAEINSYVEKQIIRSSTSTVLKNDKEQVNQINNDNKQKIEQINNDLDNVKYSDNKWHDFAQHNDNNINNKKIENTEIINNPIKPIVNKDVFKTKELNLTKELYDDPIVKQPNIEEIISKQPTTEFLYAKNDPTKPLEYQNFAEFEEQNKSRINDEKPKVENKTISFDTTLDDSKESKLNSDDNIEKVFVDYDDEFKQLFFAIAANHKSEIKDELNKKLSILKEVPSASSFNQANLFLIADKVLIASQNGAVILFDNKSQAVNFNKIINNKEFNDYFTNSFKTQKLVIGIDKKTALEYKDEYKKIKEKNFKDVKIKKENNDKKTMLLDILNDSED